MFGEARWSWIDFRLQGRRSSNAQRSTNNQPQRNQKTPKEPGNIKRDTRSNQRRKKPARELAGTKGRITRCQSNWHRIPTCFLLFFRSYDPFVVNGQTPKNEKLLIPPRGDSNSRRISTALDYRIANREPSRTSSITPCRSLACLALGTFVIIAATTRLPNK